MESLGGYFVDTDNSRSRRMVLHDHLLVGNSWNINRNMILQRRATICGWQNAMNEISVRIVDLSRCWEELCEKKDSMA